MTRRPAAPQEDAPDLPPSGGRSLLAAPIALAIALGVLAGVGGTTFRYAEGLSYFQTDPRACANCHIMQAEYDSWQKSSHHTAAVCVECHLPHAFVPKYLAKAENGWRHGKLFTVGGFKEPIEVQAAGLAILEANCTRCHGALTASMRADGVHAQPVHAPSAAAPPGAGSLACLHCHSTVGHGPRAGLGGPLTPAERTP